MSRERILHITIKDCEVQTFRCGGKGGQNKDKRDTGVRIIHRASGARGECREHRTQLANKKLAFRRMAESDTMQTWLLMATSRVVADIDIWVEKQLDPANLDIEYYTPVY
jgi:protein subunit release factor B